MRSYFYKYFINFKKEKFFEILKIKFLILNIYFLNQKKLNFKRRRKLFCIESGKKRSVNNFFLLYRMDLKSHFNNGLINGLKKISW